MSAHHVTASELVARVGRYLQSQVLPAQGVGFAFFLGLRHGDPTGGVAYASSAQRPDVVETVDEFLARDRYESPTAVETLADRDRLLLEARCAELGRHLVGPTPDKCPEFVLMLFDFGDGGRLAWFTNYRTPAHALELLRSWRELVPPEGSA